MTRVLLLLGLVAGLLLVDLPRGGPGLGASPAAAGEVTIRLQSNAKNVVDVQFYATGRRNVWPAPDKVYSIEDYKVHQYALSCQAGEQICYGAWLRGRNSTYWGVGDGNRHRCERCCFRCNGQVTDVMHLNE